MDERATPMTDDEARKWRKSWGWTKDEAIRGAKRCGVQWVPWMSDWFTSWSPRNDNSNAEGSWEHWVTLAQQILNHPFTEIVRPEVYRAVPEPPRTLRRDRAFPDRRRAARPLR